MAIGTLTLGALLLGGGLAANTYVQNSRADALKSNTQTVLRNQKRKQGELDEERQALLGQALEESAIGRDEVEKAQRERAMQTVERMRANSQPETPAPNRPDQAGIDGPAGRVISGATDREAEDNESEIAKRRTAMADLDSLGQVLGDNSRVQRPIRGEIQGNQRVAQGEADRMQLELQVAKEKAMRKKRGLEIAGQLAQGVGSGLLAGGAGSWASTGAGKATASASGGAGSSVIANTVGGGTGVGTKLATPQFYY